MDTFYYGLYISKALQEMQTLFLVRNFTPKRSQLNHERQIVDFIYFVRVALTRVDIIYFIPIFCLGITFNGLQQVKFYIKM